MAIDTPSRVAFLKKIHLFYGLKDDEIKALAEELHEVNVPKGGLIFAQDTRPDGFYLIYAGTVRITRRVEKREVQLAQFVKNDYFGEMALVANRRRSATATATSDTLLLMIPKADFSQLYKRAPHIQTNLEIAVHSRVLARTVKFKWLRPDEVIYFAARKHPLVLLEKLGLPILTLLVPAGFLYAWANILNSIIVLAAAGLSLLAILLYMLWLWIDWGNDYYIVTNQRVVWLEKVVGIYDSRQESPLGTILSVGIESNQAGKYLDYGNVIIRTFVGKIVFANVSHPNHAGRMVEEYWNRTKEHAQGIEKEAMKNALRKKLGLPLPKVDRGFGEPAPLSKSNSSGPTGMFGSLATRWLGPNRLKLRYEEGDNVIYRKHWIVLVRDGLIPVGATVATLLLFIGRMVQLTFLPDSALISLANGLRVDPWALIFFTAFLPAVGWFGYRVIDWSNDKYEVTNEQIIDIDREPFGTEVRNAAPLEGIMGTQYERKGFLGYIFNFGTVHITVGGTKMAFEDVMDPATVQSDIDRRRMARNAKKRESEMNAERDRVAEWLAAYHKAADQLKDEERRQQQQKKG